MKGKWFLQQMTQEKTKINRNKQTKTPSYKASADKIDPRLRKELVSHEYP